MQNKVLKAKLILDLSIFSTPKWHDTAKVRDADLHLGETWQEEDILCSLHLRSHMMACKLDITLPLLYYAFKPPSKREVNKWLASYKSTSVLALSPQASSKSPSILTLSPQSESSPLPSPSGGTATDDVEQECEDLKLQQNNRTLLWFTDIEFT